jgi:hypothetical protein
VSAPLAGHYKVAVVPLFEANLFTVEFPGRSVFCFSIAAFQQLSLRIAVLTSVDYFAADLLSFFPLAESYPPRIAADVSVSLDELSFKALQPG